MAGSGEGSMEEKLSDFRSLDSSQIHFLRSLFLLFSDRPRDQSHVAATVRRLYRDIPAESRGALGAGVLELFRDEERERERQREQQQQQADGEEEQDLAAAQQQKPRQDSNVPRMTWKSFQRVCSALGLHLSDRRGQAAIKQLCPPADSSNPLAEPGLTFDDFMLFYASVSKPLSAHGELKQVWALLDADLSGLVPLRVLRQCLVGFEHISPSNTRERSAAFYDSNYKYHYSEAEKSMSSEQLIDSLLRAHFADKDLENDKINFAEFCQFMAS